MKAAERQHRGQRDGHQTDRRLDEQRRAEAGDEDDAGERDGEQHGAGVVDLHLGGAAVRLERRVDDRQRQQAERQVDIEDPSPAELIDDEAAEQRAEHRRDAEHAAEEALIAAALARGDDVADDGNGGDDEAAAAEPLDDAEGDQLRQVLRHAAQARADEEDDDGRLQHDAAPVDVAELAVQRHDDRRRQQVGGDDPRQVRQAADLADDGRQRGRDDRLIQRGKQQDQHEGGKNRPAVARTDCVGAEIRGKGRALVPYRRSIGRWIKRCGRAGKVERRRLPASVACARGAPDRCGRRANSSTTMAYEAR